MKSLSNIGTELVPRVQKILGIRTMQVDLISCVKTTVINNYITKTR